MGDVKKLLEEKYNINFVRNFFDFGKNYILDEYKTNPESGKGFESGIGIRDPRQL